jgi:hypothetical protein
MMAAAMKTAVRTTAVILAVWLGDEEEVRLAVGVGGVVEGRSKGGRVVGREVSSVSSKCVVVGGRVGAVEDRVSAGLTVYVSPS